ncbi:MAG: LAGLIDADG family homing endonuclease [Nanoarchaeota archaeon]|nr:LAGLIDADG family homing endonuclease [Nanoarchaeota archaeon]
MAYEILLGRNESDKKEFGNRGIIYIGKGFVKMGQYTSLSNKLFLDVARTHIILVAGKRGSGKCLHEDTLITLADGSQIPIKDLEDNKEKIISLNDKLKIEKSEKSEFFSREVNKLIKLKLRSGKEIKLTPEHPLLTIKGWKPIQELTIGSRIATPRIMPAFGNKEMSEHEIKLLAYLIAEGHTKNIVLFANSDEKIVDDFRNSLKEFDSSLKLIKEKENHYRISSPLWKNKILNSNNIRNEKGQFTKESRNIYKKRSIRKLIEREEIFGLLSTQKYLSQNIMQLKREQLAVFLNRLFSCDGSIYKTGDYWQSSYCSSSKRMIHQIQNLLLRFGILSKIRDKKIKLNDKNFNSYEIVINAQNTLKFIEEIGFFGEKFKKQRIAYKEIKSKIRNPNIDTIPKEIWETYKPISWTKIGIALNYKYPKAMRERINYSPSRQTLLQISEVEQNNGLKILAESEIFWDEIISMEILDGQFKVYDICVPENHNFIANDIIVHNSYTLGVIAEELSNLPKEISQNIASVIFDTMGIYWTMKYQNEKDRGLLEEWDLQPKDLPVRIFVPYGHFDNYAERGIPVDKKFALDVMEMTAEDWVITFGLSLINPVGVLVATTITKLKEKGKDYFIEEIINEIEKEEKSSRDVKNAARGLFEAADSWGIFAKKETKPTNISDLAVGGKTSVLDLSVYSSIGAFNVRALVVSLVSRKLFEQRMSARKKEEIDAIVKRFEISGEIAKKEMPLIWLFIDEAHEFLPLNEKTIATDALVQLLREGRQPGISMVLATQQPGKIHKDVMTQSDIVISHRVTSAQDLEALNHIMQSYMLESISQYMNELPSLRGSAIILDDNSERIYPMRIHPRFTWHGGEAPTSIKREKKL